MAKIIKQVIIDTETIILGEQNLTHITSDNTVLVDEHFLHEEKIANIREQGFIAGKKEGQEQAAQEMTALKQNLQNLLISIPQALNQHRLELQPEIADILLLITQEYFLEQQRTPETLQLQINNLLNQLNHQQQIELILHPDEINTLQKARIKLETSHLNHFKIKADEQLTLGGCIIKTDHGMFDASLETRINTLKQFLLQIRQKGHNENMV